MIGKRSSKVNDLTGSQKAVATDVLRTVFPDAEVVAGHAFEDGEGAIVQFYDATRKWGGYGTILVRWDIAASPVFQGHYFDTGFDSDVDFYFRAKRGY